MSYPRKLHILIIEDEQDPIDGYRQLLQSFRSEGFLSVEPTIARSYADACQFIESPHIFHVVILDLNLPVTNKEQPGGGPGPGQQLLELLAQRQTYPIPVLLVVTGKIGLTRLTDLQSRLTHDFWYGAMVNKGPDVPDDLRKGLQKALDYVDVGIHLADAGREWFPTISPCEEDLLRRCVLSQQSCLGVDLEWWGAEVGPSLSRPTIDAGPTKVLMGRFILDDGMEYSRPTFFKFEPEGNAAFACRDVGILDQKLSHVKVKYSHSARGRCLLVTQSVTDSRPIPLDRLLRDDPADVLPQLPHLVGDIAGQLEQLGRCTDDQIPAKDLLWKHHNRGNIEKAWALPDVRQIIRSGSGSPLATFDRLVKSTIPIWITKRGCTHGDLNATNVAIDQTPPERPKAFIFDAAGIHADIATRDLAVLEVTTLLFLSAPEIQSHFPQFRVFYTGDPVPPAVLDAIATLPPIVQNAFHLVVAIRTKVGEMTNPDVYPLVVFDNILIQLGGLAVQPSKNKIANPVHACLLGSWVAEWVNKSANTYLPPGTKP
jgi:CheY-like chemotaxis protein